MCFATDARCRAPADNTAHTCFRTQGNLYIAEEDIKNIPCFSAETLVAVRAPHGTTLEVPDPDEGMEYPKKRYQIFLKSTSGPVEVFLVSLHEKLDDQYEKDELREAEPSCVLPSSKVTSLPSKCNAVWDPDAPVDNRPAPAANIGVYPSAASTRALLNLQAGAAADCVSNPPSSAGGNVANSPTITRIMPPSCDPDYWFSDEVKEFGIGLNDMFAPTGMDGETLCNSLSL